MSSRRAPVESDRDPGLQPERTRLAWRRTTLSCAVVAVLAVRQVLDGASTATATVAVSLTAVVFLAFLWIGHHRIQQLGAAQPRLLPPGAAVAAAACTISLAVLGTLAVW